MALQTSGQISLSDIAGELGRGTGSPFSLNNARLGQYGFINELSPSRPPATGEMRLSHWYGYNHTAVREVQLRPGSPSNGLVSYYTNRNGFVFYDPSLQPGQYSRLFTNTANNPAGANNYYYNSTDYYKVEVVNGEFGVVTGIGSSTPQEGEGYTYVTVIWKSYSSSSSFQACQRADLGNTVTSYRSLSDGKYYNSPSLGTFISNGYYTRDQNGANEIFQVSAGVLSSSLGFC